MGLIGFEEQGTVMRQLGGGCWVGKKWDEARDLLQMDGT